jgi:hypothetical protein
MKTGSKESKVIGWTRKNRRTAGWGDVQPDGQADSSIPFTSLCGGIIRKSVTSSERWVVPLF